MTQVKHTLTAERMTTYPAYLLAPTTNLFIAQSTPAHPHPRILRTRQPTSTHTHTPSHPQTHTHTSPPSNPNTHPLRPSRRVPHVLIGLELNLGLVQVYSHSSMTLCEVAKALSV